MKVLDLEDSRMREYEEGRRQPCEQVVAPSFCAGSLFSFFLCRLPLLFLSLQSPSFFAGSVSFFFLSQSHTWPMTGAGCGHRSRGVWDGCAAGKRASLATNA